MRENDGVGSGFFFSDQEYVVFGVRYRSETASKNSDSKIKPLPNI